MKKLLIVMLVLAVLAAGLAWSGFNRYQQFLEQPLALPADGAVLVVEPGMSARAVVSRLEDAAYTRNDWRWRVLLRLQPVVFQAGEYRLEAGMTPPGLLHKLHSGEVIQYRFTLVEGWSLKQLVAALNADPVLAGDALPDEESAVRQLLDMEWPHAEGAFLPETYVFVRGDTRKALLRRAHQDLLDTLMEAWQQRREDHPVQSPFELLVLASIIEKETALKDERERISGVFVRRLERGMRLQTDPTVIYGMGDAYDGDIRRRDLQTDTPYNTYTRDGLPPSPIAMAGRASLFAAAHPAPGDSLYFVADGQGGHTFSATLAEHQRAVNKLIGRN